MGPLPIIITPMAMDRDLQQGLTTHTELRMLSVSHTSYRTHVGQQRV